MTVTSMQELPPKDSWAAENGTDWRHYIIVLTSWWREIVAITVATALLAGLAAVVLNRMGGPTYTAWADVAIVRTVNELTLDPRFTTTSDTDVRYVTANATAWRNALLGLAEGPALAEQVMGQLGDLLDAQARMPADLANNVEADLIGAGGRPGNSDLIRITATADTPDKAARIATAWAEAYVRKVNQIYGQAPDELLASIQGEQSQAKANYEKAQTALEAFIANDRSDELDRQITEKQGVIDQIVKARADVAAAYLGAETQARGARFERWLQVTRALDQARTLRGQVAAGGAGSTGGGALVAELLKLQALTQVLDEPPRTSLAAQASSQSTSPGTSPGPVQVQVDATPLQIQLDANSALSQDELLADVDALVQALEQRRVELEQQIAAPGEQLVSADKSVYLGQAARGANASGQEASLPGQVKMGADAISTSSVPTTTVGSELLDSTVRGLEEEVRGLKAQLETEGARYKQLIQERDLTWDSLKTLDSKVSELAINRSAGGSEVRLAAAAVPPTGPSRRFSTAKLVVLGGTLGLLLGVFIALVANAFGIAPFFSRRQAKA